MPGSNLLVRLHGPRLALSQAPQLLDLLNAVVKVEELDLPLKRNQGYVMKYFMQHRNEIGYSVDQEPEKRRAILRESAHGKHGPIPKILRA